MYTPEVMTIKTGTWMSYFITAVHEKNKKINKKKNPTLSKCATAIVALLTSALL